MTPTARHRLIAAIVAVVVVSGACTADRNTSAPGSAATGSDIGGTINVLAAASLTAAFTDIGAAFHAAHPAATVEFSFDASSTLVTQINEGAPADVFASADEANMQKVTGAGWAEGTAQVFATNALQIIVEKGNPKRIRGVTDLAQPDLIYVACAPEVPIGKYAAQVLRNAQVTVTPASLEQNVKGIVSKVTAGEADAGIVYRTDVSAARGDADGVDIPADINVTARYPIVVTRRAPNPAGARAFVAFVLSREGQDILAGYGFTAP